MTDNKSLLIKVIEDYKKSVADDDIPQHSDEWYEIRKTTVGGSEIASIIGYDKYKSAKMLLKSKLFPVKTDSMIAMTWGTILEEVTNIWTEMLLDTEVLECGSVNGCIPGQRYSADGITVAKIDGEYKIIVTEYKSPYYAELCNSIPIQYFPQVQIGLQSIPISHASIFVSNYYRACMRINHLMYENNEVYLHNKLFSRESPPVDTSCVLGITVIYLVKKEFNDNLCEIDEITDDELIEKYTNTKPVFISHLLDKYDENIHKIIYGKLYKTGSLNLEWVDEHPAMNHNKAYIELLREHDSFMSRNSLDIITYSPIKLYDSYIEYSERNNDWYEQAKPIISNFIDVLNESINLNDKDKEIMYKNIKFKKMPIIDT